MPDNNNQNQIPTNLPTGELPKQPQSNEPVDILSDVDEAPADQQVEKPQTRPDVSAQGGSKAPGSVPPAVSPPPRSVSKSPIFSQGKKIVAGIFALIFIAALIGGGWYAYSAFFADSSAVPNENIGNQGTNQGINQNQQAPNNTGADDFNGVDDTPVDTDKDGLSDEEEALYNTDPTKVDTDQDGLTDRDEIIVFKTDPNNPDTDGDGFLDGAEVREGYDPNGPGRLLEIN